MSKCSDCFNNSGLNQAEFKRYFQFWKDTVEKALNNELDGAVDCHPRAMEWIEGELLNSDGKDAFEAELAELNDEEIDLEDEDDYYYPEDFSGDTDCDECSDEYVDDEIYDGEISDDDDWNY